MASIKQIIIADAGPIIHLDELNSLNILADFEQVLVPDAMWCEIEQHSATLLAEVISKVKNTTEV
ncbi:MAG: hypothetical protein Q7U38_13445 [Methylobacter sp.]|nr:hypothetical protein [Methylobacter sp.]MDP2099712.1 hypothetical protein [Methylobacter sp.]MDP2430345.1 hypothetical protein [Methylobacter sp.]MDP3053514.1 hypothetical protein [Methylobacter sp.]MDP3362693.1 hypothetical protein [Methylobacter sp.]